MLNNLLLFLIFFFLGKERLVVGFVGFYGVFLYDGFEYFGSYVDNMFNEVFILFSLLVM